MPAVALRGTTILPGMIVHFDISRKVSSASIDRAMLRDEKIFLITQRDPHVENPEIDDLWNVGTISRIKQVVRLPKNMIRVLVEGETRAEILSFEKVEDYSEAVINIPAEEPQEMYPESLREAMMRNIRQLLRSYMEENNNISRDLASQIMEANDISKMMDQVAINLPLSYEQRQQILEAVTLIERYDAIGVLLTNETDIYRIRRELQDKVRERVDKNQREYILREQMKVIREELGEDTTLSDIDRFKEGVDKLKASKEVKERILEEIRRFQNLPGQSPESAVTRGYIETLLAMPWDKASRDRKDLKRAKDILERDHYGLEKVKERILEFLAVRQLTGKGEGPILCLVGPPGTGKTSIGRSIAEALGKKYIRMSLGGVRDEAEIRGHRRTYVGALPGRRRDR